MSKTFQGKTALVTGGSRGLGAVVAKQLAKQGANVAITYVASEAKAAAVVNELKEFGVKAIAIKSDQGDLASAQPLIDTVISEFGKLDILINNAGIAIQGQLIDDPTLDAEKFNSQWHVNVLGSIAVTRAAAAKLTDGGRIIFIGSLLGSYVPFAGAADYAGSKTALVGYARVLLVILVVEILPSTLFNLVLCQPTWLRRFWVRMVPRMRCLIFILFAVSQLWKRCLKPSVLLPVRMRAISQVKPSMWQVV